MFPIFSCRSFRIKPLCVNQFGSINPYGYTVTKVSRIWTIKDRFSMISQQFHGLHLSSMSRSIQPGGFNLTTSRGSVICTSGPHWRSRRCCENSLQLCLQTHGAVSFKTPRKNMFAMEKMHSTHWSKKLYKQKHEK